LEDHTSQHSLPTQDYHGWLEGRMSGLEISTVNNNPWKWKVITDNTRI